MSDSTKRALRTLFHGLIALVTAIPDIAAHLPSSVVVAQVVVVAAAVSKIVNSLEESGYLPGWLK